MNNPEQARSSSLVQLAFETGAIAERQRIINLIQPHLAVCNYKAVTEEDCDVCHWVKQTIKDINNTATIPKPDGQSSNP
jgi:hypothetical protein